MGAKDIKPYGDLMHEAKVHGGAGPYVKFVENEGIAKGHEIGIKEGRIEGATIATLIIIPVIALIHIIVKNNKVKKEAAINVENGENAKKELSKALSDLDTNDGEERSYDEKKYDDDDTIHNCAIK